MQSYAALCKPALLVLSMNRHVSAHDANVLICRDTCNPDKWAALWLQMLKPPPQDQLQFDPHSFAAEPAGEYSSIERRKCGGPCNAPFYISIGSVRGGAVCIPIGE